MKSLCLYIVILATLIKSIASFSCEDIYLDSKNTLYKATSQKKVENEIKYSYGTEYNTWYIDPCRSVENEPKDYTKEKCPDNSRVCLVKTIEFNDEKKRKVIDIIGYAVSTPVQDPFIRQGNYTLYFEGEKESNYSAEINFSCAGDEKSNPDIELDANKKKVKVFWKGICVTDNKTEPIKDDDGKDNNNKKSGGHFIIRFILIIIICYFIIGMCYNYFVLNKNGLDIIPHIDILISVFGPIFDKISDLFGRRDYRPILQ
ncbi:autophagy-related protein 27 [Neocallimastix sp. 'constans']|jgi:hypothetical protein